MKKFKVLFWASTSYTVVIEAENGEEAEAKWDVGDYDLDEDTGDEIDSGIASIEELKT